MNKELIHYTIKRVLRIVLHVYWVFPVRRDRICLINEQSFTYGDNLKYINEYIIQNCHGKYEVIYPVKEGSEKAPLAVSVKPMSLKYFYYVLTSKAVYTNCGGLSYLPKRKNQLFVNTWHGGGAYKKVGTDVWNTKYSRAEDRMNAENTDYLFSSCEAFSRMESIPMMFKKEQCLPVGLPRNDIFFRSEETIKSKVYGVLGLKKNEKLVLYAPTYRSDTSSFANSKNTREIDIDYKTVVNSLENSLGGVWRFGIRLHPRIGEVEFDDACIVNCTKYPDMQELLYASSAVITDYSSLMWDFSLSKKPCFIYAPDIDQYETERGFYTPVKEWPFPIARSNEELILNIRRFDNIEYIARVEQHHRNLGSYEKGIACKAALDLLG